MAGLVRKTKCCSKCARPKTKYQCLVCGRWFGRNDNAKIHAQCHFDIRPFQCNLCDFKSKTKYVMKVHKQNHRESNLNNDTNIGQVVNYNIGGNQVVNIAGNQVVNQNDFRLGREMKLKIKMWNLQYNFHEFEEEKKRRKKKTQDEKKKKKKRGKRNKRHTKANT
eukprot:287545_1